MKEILIDNCLSCPFCNNDNEYGADSCNLNNNIVMPAFEPLPNDKVHELCPLLKESALVKLK